MDKFFNLCATRIATGAGQPLAFVTAFLLIVVWGVTGPLSIIRIRGSWS